MPAHYNPCTSESSFPALRSPADNSKQHPAATPQHVSSLANTTGSDTACSVLASTARLSRAGQAAGHSQSWHQHGTDHAAALTCSDSAAESAQAIRLSASPAVLDYKHAIGWSQDVPIPVHPSGTSTGKASVLHSSDVSRCDHASMSKTNTPLGLLPCQQQPTADLPANSQSSLTVASEGQADISSDVNRGRVIPDLAPAQVQLPETEHSRGLQQLWNRMTHTSLAVPSPSASSGRDDGYVLLPNAPSGILSSRALTPDVTASFSQSERSGSATFVTPGMSSATIRGGSAGEGSTASEPVQEPDVADTADVSDSQEADSAR